MTDDRAADPSRVRVLVADDEKLMRAGLRLMIDGANGVSVIGEAADGAQALDQVERLDPDVVLMDIRMPGTDGIEATRRLGQAGVRASVVVLTAFDTDTFLLDALRAGAVSFLLKDSPPEQVVQAVHDAAQGDSRFSPTVLQRLVRLAAEETPDHPVQEPPGEPTGPAAPHYSAYAPDGLTTREWEVGRLVAQGLTNSDIGDALFLSLPTVKTHVAHLFEKLQVTNRVQLALKVLEIDDACCTGPPFPGRSPSRPR